jgi:hypothetical protein
VRRLSAGEIALLRSCFGDRIDYASVRLIDGAAGNPLAAIAFRSGNHAITLGRSIRYAPGIYREDYACGDPYFISLLLHEVTHVWQWAVLGRARFVVRYGWNFATAGFRPARAYLYRDDTSFAAARIEAQAQMVGDYCLALQRNDAPLQRRLARNLAGSGLYGF